MSQSISIAEANAAGKIASSAKSKREPLVSSQQLIATRRRCQGVSSARRPGQAERIAQGRAVVLSAEQASTLQLRHEAVDQLLEAPSGMDQLTVSNALQAVQST